jgi:hypothetical protein
MGRVCIYFTAVLAIAANLLTPEQWVSYQHCCYDENGNVMACALERDTPSRTPVLRDACCDPITHQLRTAPAPVVTDAKNSCDVPHFDAIPAPVPIYIAQLFESRLPDRALSNTGPPATSSDQLLSQHCRFNI